MVAALTAQSPLILYEDNHLLVALKPPGILAQSDGSLTPDMLTLLKYDLKMRYNKPGSVFLGLVHRLDQPVGGIMVFARNSKAAARLSAQIRARQLEKVYLAVVAGQPHPADGSLTDQLLKDRADGTVRVVAAGQGQAAWLDYTVLAFAADQRASLVAIRLGSGRPHQIRVQFATRGWPILGDHRYGLAGGVANLFAAPALFACALGLNHPVGGERRWFTAEPPAAPPWNWFVSPDLTDIIPAFTIY